ncbi:hypothetical protein [Mariniphaga sp.]
MANVTNKDVHKFLRITAEIPFNPDVEIYPFEWANEALLDIKNGKK